MLTPRIGVGKRWQHIKLRAATLCMEPEAAFYNLCFCWPYAATLRTPRGHIPNRDILIDFSVKKRNIIRSSVGYGVPAQFQIASTGVNSIAVCSNLKLHLCRIRIVRIATAVANMVIVRIRMGLVAYCASFSTA